VREVTRVAALRQALRLGESESVTKVGQANCDACDDGAPLTEESCVYPAKPFHRRSFISFSHSHSSGSMSSSSSDPNVSFSRFQDLFDAALTMQQYLEFFKIKLMPSASFGTEIGKFSS
jgi:hypothetical protein